MGMGMVVPMCFFVAAWSYPLAVNFVPRYKTVVDAYSVTEVGVRDTGASGDAEKAEAILEETAPRNDAPTVK